MPFSITGYVLEPPRVGQANSPFTFTPNNYISDQVAFNTAYPSNESAPPTQYLVQVMQDGDLPVAVFGWTKNEVIPRFDYDGREQRFKPLPGKGLEILGQLGPTSNTSRLKVTIKPLSTDITNYPIRISVGTGSGVTFTVSLVLAFGSPPVGTVELLESSGELNWNSADLTTYSGQDVRFQRQTFFGYQDSTGNLGLIDDPLLLNPLPATGQYPLIRIGFGTYLSATEVANDAGLLPLPSPGVVKWSRTTGRLAFNATDVSTNTGRPVYYDGVLIVGSTSLSPISAGTLGTPGVVSPYAPLTLPWNASTESSDTFFRVPGVVQFPQTKFVDAFTPGGKKGTVEIRRSDGQVQFSDADIVAYGGGSAVDAFIPDLLIERGMRLRLYRTPIDPAATDPTNKDVSAFYTTTQATLADPIIAAPQVFLPAVPVDTAPLTVQVIDKSGTTITLPRMDVPSPPTQVGYYIDYEKRNLLYANRKNNQVIPAPEPYGAVQLPDPMVLTQGLVLELETAPGSNTYVPLTLGQDALLDSGSGTVSLVDTQGTLMASGAGGAFLAASTNFSDAGQDFLTAGVLPGDFLVVRTGTSMGVYTVVAIGSPTVLTTDVPTPSPINESNLTYEVRRGEEILADRYWQPIPVLDPNTKVERVLALGTTTNSPRFSVPLTYASVAKSRFRFGPSTFSTSVTTVANDLAFTTPSLMAAGAVEISLTTGNLNFAQADVTAALTVYWVRTLTLGTDYTVQPALGFIQFTDRFLAKEEAILTYKNANDPNTVIVEQGTFLVRKEMTAAHPVPTNTLTFNPLGRPVTLNPQPRVFRGGRPQVTGSQVNVNPTTNTITFLADTQITDALPHGPIVKPNENVYIDYYITQAVGGEQSITVIQPPMATGVVQTLSNASQVLGNGVVSGGDRLLMPGDITAEVVTDSLLRVEGDRNELYQVASSTYSPGDQATLVILTAPQTFLSDVSTPKFSVTSGVTRTSGSYLLPSYFVVDATPFQPIPRGSNKIRFKANVETVYRKGVIINLTDSGPSYLDFYQVDGSTFDTTSGLTEVTLTANTYRQYPPPVGTTIVKRSIRPIFPDSVTTAQTIMTPNLALPYTVFRRVEGQVGKLLQQPTDYKINESGTVTFTQALQPHESWDIMYSGYTIVEAGRRLRASYTFQIVPSEANGLLGGTLVADYTTYIPDTFFWRVETFTNFRGELAAQYTKEAQASIPSGGPMLSNMSSPKLYEQGRESLFFQEEHLANEDIVARATLKFYNDSINYLEDALQDMDGRVVGDRDGRFLFDGNIDNPDRATFAMVTNQIDDRFKISPAPYSVTFPPFVVTSIGTYQLVYLAAATSRFYPTQRARYNVVATGTNDGDPILDTKSTNLTSAFAVQRRSPWAVLVQAAAIGDTVLYVDFSEGDADLLRPGFVATEKVQIADSTLSYATGLTVSSTNAVPTPQTITLTAALTVAVPAGATVFLDSTDTVYKKGYRVGIDVGVDLKGGQLTYIVPGSVDITPANVSPAAGEVLDLTAQLNPQGTTPDRFPALDGLTTDDDGDRALPALNPSLASEAPDLNGTTVGHLGTEQSIIETGTGTLRTATTAPYLGTGTITGGNTITATVAFPGTTVKPYDLVRILSGTNAGSSYHRILTVVGTVITVTPADYNNEPGVSFTVTASASLGTGGTGGGLSTSTVLDDPGATFQTWGVLPGHTVVVDGPVLAPSLGERRQVLAVASETSLTVSSAFSASLSGQNYRIDDALATFGGVGSIQAQLATELAGELAVLDTNTSPFSERQAIEQFYDSVFTDVFTSATGSTATSVTLTDLSANFTLDMEGDYVYIRYGADGGVYKIQTVTSPTTLDVETPGFPATLAGVSYRIARSTGATKQTLQALFPVLQAVDAFIPLTTAFLSKVTTTVPVVPDTSAFALEWQKPDLDARETDVTARLTSLSGPTGSVATIESILSAGDRWYDARFVWIDARINLEKGILVSKDRAVQNRIKAQEDILKQLIKLQTT